MSSAGYGVRLDLIIEQRAVKQTIVRRLAKCDLVHRAFIKRLLQLAAVLLQGASGGWLGTRFVASEEWGGAAQDQQAVLAAGADDTVRTTVYDQVRGAPFPEGIADRVLRNAFTSAWEGRTGDIAARQAELRRELEEAAERGDPTVVDISAGVAVGLISSLEPAGAIVRRIVEETERVLRERVALLLREAPHR